MARERPGSRNRVWWDATSDTYQQQHGEILEREPRAWGIWRLPESELEVLGDVRGLDVLELGCGAAQWTLDLAKDGARAVGFDLSGRQLAHARRRERELGVAAPLVLGDAERLPFRAESFDVVFCDHGAMSFARPERAVAEAARVVRPGGLFAFATASPLHDLCWDETTGALSPRLVVDYFSLYEIEDQGSISYQLPYGGWLRLFRRTGFEVEDLLELRPPAGATTTYADYAGLEWARRWPAENLWKLRRLGG